MSYRNTVETKVADFVTGQYVIFPTTSSGSWSGIFVGFAEPLGQYAREGEVNVIIHEENSGQEYTLRTSRLYSGYMAPVADEDEEEAPEPTKYLYEVQVPVRGEVIFTVEAFTEDEAREIADSINWGDGELNVEFDAANSTNVVRLGEA